LVGLCAGCGGDDDGVDCSGFSACGGDPVGNWTIQGICLDPDSDPIPACDGEQVSANITQSGTVMVTSDGYTTSVTTQGTVTVTVPGSCLTGLTSCDQLSSPDQTCSGDVSSSCSCRSDVDEMSSETGTYTTSGGVLTLMPSGGTTETLEYCVNGDTFRVRDGPSIVVLVR
jgi:hypothetical protein